MSTFRPTYRFLTDAEQERIQGILSCAERLENAINDGRTQRDAQHRMLALAMTNLEQAVMWAVKAYTG